MQEHKLIEWIEKPLLPGIASQGRNTYYLCMFVQGQPGSTAKLVFEGKVAGKKN